MDCRQALQIIELGGSPESAASETGVDVAEIAQWLANARALASLKTKYGSPRLFHPDRLARATATVSRDGTPIVPAKKVLLLPSEPKTAAEWHDCDLLLEHLQTRLADPKLQAEVAFALAHVIEKFDTRNSGVAFRKPEDMQRFLNVFDGSHIVGGRWHVQICLGDHVPAEPWIRMLPKDATYADTRKANQREGEKGRGRATEHVRLHLLHPAWTGAGKGSFTKYTAHTLGYVMHLMAIIDQNVSTLLADR